MLALIAEIIHGASNIKFGPELYCGPRKKDWDVVEGDDDPRKPRWPTTSQRSYPGPQVTFVADSEGDARCDHLFNQQPAVIRRRHLLAAVSSRTRLPRVNTRLELAFLEMVTDRLTLREIKKAMLRSHTKGIYKNDNDKDLVKTNPSINAIVRKLKYRIREKTHGFAELYPTVVQEYFGGMKRHFGAMRNALRPGAKCAYVVGDQAGYVGVHIPTAEILAELAIGSRATIQSKFCSGGTDGQQLPPKHIQENILIFEY